eukprot:jgi/Chrzof1/3928/Cz13g13210.t1
MLLHWRKDLVTACLIPTGSSTEVRSTAKPTKGTGSWRQLSYTSDVAPEERIAAQAVCIGNHVWLIGGWNPSKQGPEAFLSDIWKLDLATNAWTEVHTEGVQLEGISRFQAVALGEQIYIHTHRNLADILVLDTSSEPPVLRSVPVSGTAPPSRGLQSLTAVGGALYLFGGAPQKGPMVRVKVLSVMDTARQ